MPGKKATPAEIARELYREDHTISVLLTRMEKEGFVKKIKDLERKNQVRIILTSKGRRVYNQSKTREYMHSIMDVLPEGERKQMIVNLTKIKDKASEELR